MHLELWDYYSPAEEVLDGASEAKSSDVPCDLYTGASSLPCVEGNGRKQRAWGESEIWTKNSTVAGGRPCVICIRVDAGESQAKGESAAQA